MRRAAVASDSDNGERRCRSSHRPGPATGTAKTGVAFTTCVTEFWPWSGRKANISSKCLMQVMYGSRLARWDTLRAVNHLATKLTKWTAREDKKLFRLIRYLKGSLSYRQVAFIGDPPEKLKLELFTDADFASDKADYKSTSGGFLCITGPNSFYPLSAICKKQTAVSHSSVESELLAVDHGLLPSFC